MKYEENANAGHMEAEHLKALHRQKRANDVWKQFTWVQREVYCGGKKTRT
jgi:hypothetical protein